MQIGLVGLVESDWMETLSTIDPEDVEYIDYVEEGNKLCKQLREQVFGICLDLLIVRHLLWCFCCLTRMPDVVLTFFIFSL